MFKYSHNIDDEWLEVKGKMPKIGDGIVRLWKHKCRLAKSEDCRNLGIVVQKAKYSVYVHFPTYNEVFVSDCKPTPDNEPLLLKR